PGQVLDLDPSVVVVELALHVPAVRRQRASDAVTDHRSAAVANVQRAGRVGGYVFHPGHAAAAAVVAAVAGALGVDPAQLLLPGAGGEAEVDETRARDPGVGQEVAGGQR